MGRPSIRSRSRTTDLVIVAAAAVASHATAVGGGNIWLDHAHLEDGLALAAPGQWLELFTRGFAGTGFYRPLVALSFSIDASLAKTPLFFHGVTLAWHSAAAVMTAWVASALGCSRRAALLGGLLFAVHPVTSLVAGANAFRSEAMTAVFLLGLIAAHLARRPFLAAAALFAAALSKETGWVLGPLAVLVLELVPSRPKSRREPRREVLSAEALAFAAATLLHLAFAPAFRARHAELSLAEAIGSRLAVFGKGALALLLPIDGSICDAFPVTGLTEPRALFGALALVAVPALVLQRDPDAGPLGLALRPKPAAWLFALTLIPLLQLVPVMRWWSPHYVYVPLAFGAILAAEFVEKRLRTPWTTAAVLVPLALLSAKDSLRFASDATLWTAEVEREPACREGQFFLGEVARETGNLEQAAAHYERAASATPGYLAYADEGAAYANLGAVRLAQRQFAEAREAFSSALERTTEPLETRRLTHNLATATLASGDARRAVELLEPEVRRSDALPESLFVYARALHTLGREPEALALIARLGSLSASPDASR